MAVWLAWVAAVGCKVFGVDLTMIWDFPGDGDNVVGYNLYVIAAGQTQSGIDIGLTTSYTLAGVEGGGPFLIYLRAYNSVGVEGPPSEVLEYPPNNLCLMSLSPPGASVSSVRTLDTIAVIAPDGCAFTATSDSPWITVTGVRQSGGQSLIDYAIDSNRQELDRAGNIFVGGLPFPIQQAAGVPISPFILKRTVPSGAVDEDGALVLGVQTEREDGPVLYQWFKDGQAIDGATNSTYVRANVQLADGGAYTVQASNDFGVTVDIPMNIAIYQRPRLLPGSDLATQLVNLGDTVFFGVNASGSDLQYFWTKDGIPVGDSTPTLFFPSVSQNDLGFYEVTVSNRLGVIQVPGAYLTTRQFERQLGRLHVSVRPDQSLHFQAEGVPGAAYQIQVSKDLVAWKVIDSAIVDDGGLFTIDAPTPSGGNEGWFVRTVRVPLPRDSSSVQSPSQ